MPQYNFQPEPKARIVEIGSGVYFHEPQTWELTPKWVLLSRTHASVENNRGLISLWSVVTLDYDEDRATQRVWQVRRNAVHRKPDDPDYCAGEYMAVKVPSYVAEEWQTAGRVHKPLDEIDPLEPPQTWEVPRRTEREWDKSREEFFERIEKTLRSKLDWQTDDCSHLRRTHSTPEERERLARIAAGETPVRVAGGPRSPSRDDYIYLIKTRRDEALNTYQPVSWGSDPNILEGVPTRARHITQFAFRRWELEEHLEQGDGSMRGWTLRDPVVGAEEITIDIDHEHPAIAKTWARDLSRMLTSKGVEHDVWYSGSKGFHISIHQNVVGGIKPAATVPRRVCRFAEYLVDLANQDVPNRIRRFQSGNASDIRIDTNPYTAIGTIRLPGAAHEKTGRYKVRLTPGQLKWSMPRIEEWASHEPTPAQIENRVGEFNLKMWWVWQVASVEVNPVEVRRSWVHDRGGPINIPEMVKAVEDAARDEASGRWDRRGDRINFHCIKDDHDDSGSPDAWLRLDTATPAYQCYGCGEWQPLHRFADEHLGISPVWPSDDRTHDVKDKRDHLYDVMYEILSAYERGEITAQEANRVFVVSAGLGKTTMALEIAAELGLPVIHMARGHHQIADALQGRDARHLDRTEADEPGCGIYRHPDTDRLMYQEMDRRAMQKRSRFEVCLDCPLKPIEGKPEHEYPTRLAPDGTAITGPCQAIINRNEAEGEKRNLGVPHAYLGTQQLGKWSATRGLIIGDEDPLESIRKTCAVVVEDVREEMEEGHPLTDAGLFDEVDNDADLIDLIDPGATTADVWKYLMRGEIPPRNLLPDRTYVHQRLSLDPAVLAEREEAWKEAVRKKAERDGMMLSTLRYQLQTPEGERTRKEFEQEWLRRKVEGVMANLYVEEVDDDVTRLINVLIGGQVADVRLIDEAETEGGETIPAKLVFRLESNLPDDVPIWILDASPHERDLQAYCEELPGLRFERVIAHNPESVIIQDPGSVWSRKRIKKGVQQWYMGERDHRIGRVVRFLDRIREAGKEWGLITHKDSALIPLLKSEFGSDPMDPAPFLPFDDQGKPSQYCWFGALRGLNTLEHVDWLVVLGCQCTPSWGYDEDALRFGYDGRDVIDHVDSVQPYEAPHGAYKLNFRCPQPITPHGEHLWHRKEVSELYQAVMRARLLTGSKRVLLLTHVGIEVPECRTKIDPYVLWREGAWERIIEGGEHGDGARVPEGYDGNLAQFTVDEIKRMSQETVMSDTEIASWLGVSRRTVHEHRLLSASERKLEAVRRVLDEKPDATHGEIAEQLGMGRKTVRRIRKKLSMGAY
ncbi:hypothetical protein FIV42_15395 [Persicimonas caeni]|uniref:Uncharacterized protein n=1 Tax=Persicimonas caeni TaxID=2292766 RepID=A0A4Y6PVQ6_PERCE|nr:hypothetical protein [Persicimonas caeni]QDG52077.1 hypothetical protein FIV42_15395 [Persicimonas caeni]QED33298.1 hypothetical protein FRD00_15390 [Persicimonas caeni]